MLKRNWALIAFVYLALAEALSWAPVPDLALCLIEPEHSQQAADYDNKKYCPTFHMGAALVFERVDAFLEHHDKSVVGGFTIVLAVSTIGLWLATNKLWRAGEVQKLLAEDTAERQLRAYVSVESGLVIKQKGNLRFEFRPVIVNNGNTPAKDVRIVSNMGIVPPAVPDSFDYSLPFQIGGSVSNVGPKQHRFHSMIWQRKVTIGEMRRVVRGDWIFHLYGTVRYLDVFDKERTTNFSFALFLGRKRDAPIWHYTERNNHAD
jgi:hypothetical protein